MYCTVPCDFTRGMGLAKAYSSAIAHTGDKVTGL